jgi:hypothetical protein
MKKMASRFVNSPYTKIYYYVHTGHRIGLDRFRRAVAILNALDEDITLLTSDYRIAQVAREFGIEKCVGLDVVRNIPQIAHNGDRLIFDSDEANPIMLEDMREYFSTFIHLKNETIAIAPHYFEAGTQEKSVALSYFFGDDDYEKDLEKNLDFVSGLDLHLGLGFYYFLDYEAMLEKKFPKYFTFEEYDKMIMSSKVLITSSPQAVLDSLASGAKPIYLQREDYVTDFNKLFESFNIPIVQEYDRHHLNVILESINENKYVKITQKENKIIEFIKESLAL